MRQKNVKICRKAYKEDVCNGKCFKREGHLLLLIYCAFDSIASNLIFAI